MKALRIERFGAPSDVLKVVEVDQAPTCPDEVRVRVEAAGVNPSDVANVHGRFPITTLPRIVGRDFAGTVVEGPADLIGLPVWGTGGDVGFTRDGTHAEFINVLKAAVSRRPRNLSAEQAAAVGVPSSPQNPRLIWRARGWQLGHRLRRSGRRWQCGGRVGKAKAPALLRS
jgi:NADPH:quinone reductase-like Zn-dependent oxidoreductase